MHVFPLRIRTTTVLCIIKILKTLVFISAETFNYNVILLKLDLGVRDHMHVYLLHEAIFLCIYCT